MKLFKLYILFFSCMHLSAQDNKFLPTVQGELIEHQNYYIDYNERTEQANWVAYELKSSELNGPFERKDDFRIDTLVSTGSASPKDYEEPVYDQGHLAPADDFTFSEIAMSESFYMSNMSPQSASLNRGMWKRMENRTREWAEEKGTVYVFSGTICNSPTPNTIGENNVVVPDYYFKVVYHADGNNSQAIAFILPHLHENTFLDISNYVTTIDSVEAVTEIDFLTQVEPHLQSKIESEKADLTFWPLTTSSSTESAMTTEARQCLGISKSSQKRCGNQTKSENQYCHLHQDQYVPGPSLDPLRCQGLTKSGKQCKRKRKEGKEYCWQHD